MSAFGAQVTLPRLESLLSVKVPCRPPFFFLSRLAVCAHRRPAQVRNIINGLRLCHPRYLLLHVVQEDSKHRQAFMRLLVDDRLDDTFAYYEFLNCLRMQTSK